MWLPVGPHAFVLVLGAILLYESREIVNALAVHIMNGDYLTVGTFSWVYSIKITAPGQFQQILNGVLFNSALNLNKSEPVVCDVAAPVGKRWHHRSGFC